MSVVDILNKTLSQLYADIQNYVNMSVNYVYYYINSTTNLPDDVHSQFIFKAAKYSNLKYFSMVRRYEEPTIMRPIYQALNKFVRRDIPFQLPDFFSYPYKSTVYWYYQSDFSYFYTNLFFFGFLLLALYLFSKFSGYVNSYYRSCNKIIFRPKDWFISDTSLMYSSKLSVIANFTLLFILLNVAVLYGLEFAIFNFEGGQLLFYNYYISYGFPRRSGAFYALLDTLRFDRVYRKIIPKKDPRIHQIYLKDFYDYVAMHPAVPRHYKKKTNMMAVREIFHYHSPLPKRRWRTHQTVNRSHGYFSSFINFIGLQKKFY